MAVVRIGPWKSLIKPPSDELVRIAVPKPVFVALRASAIPFAVNCAAGPYPVLLMNSSGNSAAIDLLIGRLTSAARKANGTVSSLVRGDRVS